MGTDYYADYTLDYDDPKKAYEIFRKYPSIPDFIRHYKSDRNTNKHTEALIMVRKEFLETGEVVTEQIYNFRKSYRKFDLDSLYKYFNDNGIIYDTVFKECCENLINSVNSKLKHSKI